MNTILSVDEIELLIYNSIFYNKRTDVFVPNVSFGFLSGYEADLLIMNKSGYVTEIEIKRSYNDFMKDFKKEFFHCDDRIREFYYCVPINILDKVLNKLVETKTYVNGVYYFTDNNELYFKSHKDIPYIEDDLIVSSALRNKGRKLFLEEQIKLLKLGSFRIYNLKQKLISMKNHNINMSLVASDINC